MYFNQFVDEVVDMSANYGLCMQTKFGNPVNMSKNFVIGAMGNIEDISWW
jgi:hypothetical protein